MAGGVDGLALGALAAGSLFAYAGIRGYSVPHAIQALVSGQPPSTGGHANQISGTPADDVGPGSPAGSATSSAIATDALRYQGHCYIYGGAPGRDGTGCWDCSSFCNWVLGHDLKLAIPGYKTYDGTVHGPATTEYLIWGGGQHIPQAQLEAGDLVVGFSHMGIAIGGNSYISAHDPAERTTVTPIAQHFPDPVWHAIRVKAAAAAAGQPGPQPGKTQLAGF